MSAVSEIKVTLSIKNEASKGIKLLINEEKQAEKETKSLGKTLISVFEKKRKFIMESSEFFKDVKKAKEELDRLQKKKEKEKKKQLAGKAEIRKDKIKVNKAEIAKTREELEQSFSKIKVKLSESSFGKGFNRLQQWVGGKALNVQIGIADVMKKAGSFTSSIKNGLTGRLAAPVEKLKKGLASLKKPYRIALALRDMASDRLKNLIKRPRQMFVNMAARVSNVYDRSAGSSQAKKNGPANPPEKNSSGKAKGFGSTMMGFAKTGLLALGDLAVKGISEAVKSGAELEKQNLYMDQAIASSKPNMGADEVKRQRGSYMKQLRDSAAGTGMDSADVIAAGTQAVGITGGDTKEAMELVKVAQDMAAMNPGKSVAEAMEALSAAKGGDMAGLEELGANVSADDVKKLGFKGAMQQKLKPQFAGGAEKLSGTGAGLVSVIKGKLNNKMQDMGLSILEKLKPALESVVKLIDRYSPTLDAFGEGIASGIGIAIEWVQKIAGLIGEKFSWIGEKSGFLKEVFLTSWEGIKSQMATVWEFIQPVMDLIANGAMLLFNIFQWAFPGIQAVIENVWSFVKPILEGLGGAISWVADKVGMAAEWFDNKKGSSRGGGGAGVFSDTAEVKLRNQQTFPISPVEALRTSAVASAGLQVGAKLPSSESYKADGMPKAYGLPQTSHRESSAVVQNPQITININGINKSTNEIANEMIPKLKLALANISSGSFTRARLGGAL